MIKEGVDRVRKEVATAQGDYAVTKGILSQAEAAENHDGDFYQRVDDGWQSWQIPAGLSWPTANSGEDTNGWAGKSGEES